MLFVGSSFFFRYGGFTFGEERKVVPKSFESLPYDDIKRLYSRHAAKARNLCSFPRLLSLYICQDPI